MSRSSKDNPRVRHREPGFMDRLESDAVYLQIRDRFRRVLVELHSGKPPRQPSDRRRSRGRKSPNWTDEYDALLVRLREKLGWTWKQIAGAFPFKPHPETAFRRYKKLKHSR